jgi:Domain of unknown function (DUF6457)
VDNVYDWSSSAAQQLDLPKWTGDPDAVRCVLDLARVTAHRVARPAAPVGAFLAGVAVGLSGADAITDLERARATLEAMLPAADAGSDGAAQ